MARENRAGTVGGRAFGRYGAMAVLLWVLPWVAPSAIGAPLPVAPSAAGGAGQAGSEPARGPAGKAVGLAAAAAGPAGQVAAAGEPAGWSVGAGAFFPRGGWRVRRRARLLAPPGARAEVVVVATSDLHGWVVRDTLYPGERPGGLAHLAPVIAELRRGDPGLILIDGGDLLQGAPNLSLFQHRPSPPPVIVLMNRLAYDAIALGNHDLDRGAAALARRVGQTAFPWLAANVEAADGSLPFAPYRIVERGGVRVAVVGLTTPGVPAWVDRARLGGLRFLDLEAAARRWLAVVRDQEKADVVVGLLHSGLNGSYDRRMAVRLGLPLPNGAGRVADGVPGFDLIVSGHAHRLSPRKSRSGDSPYSVPVIQPGARGQAVAVARLRLGERDGRWAVQGITRVVLPPAIKADPALLAEVADDLARTRRWLAVPTAVRFGAIPGAEQFHHCAGALSHLAAAASRRTGPGRLTAGAAAAAAGGRSGLPPAVRPSAPPYSLLPMMWRLVPPGPEEIGAPVRRAHLRRWLRYDNSLVLANLKARQMALLLGPFARRRRGLRARATMVLHPGGLEVTLAPGGTEVVALADAKTGRALPRHAAFPVWLTNYHWNGGGGVAAAALVVPEQKILFQPASLREEIFALLQRADANPLPPACRGFLRR
ncbi:MAG: metallophosphoesterase [bacterium]